MYFEGFSHFMVRSLCFSCVDVRKWLGQIRGQTRKYDFVQCSWFCTASGMIIDNDTDDTWYYYINYSLILICTDTTAVVLMLRIPPLSLSLSLSPISSETILCPSSYYPSPLRCWGWNTFWVLDGSCCSGPLPTLPFHTFPYAHSPPPPC